MTTLSRQTQKVFALNANADMLAVFGTMKTGTPVYDTALSVLQSADYLIGWQNAIKADKAPYLEEMNAVQYGFSYQIAYLLQEGVPEYDVNTNYSETSLAKSVINNEIIVYRSLSDDNLGNSLTDTTYWMPIFTTQSKTLTLTGELSGNVTINPAQTTINLSGAINQSDKIDGQWVFSTQLLSSATAIGKYSISLSSYLPNDNYKYAVKVLFKGFRNSGDTDSVISICPTSTVATFETDIGVIPCYAMSEFDGNHAESGNFEAEVIIDTDRIFYYSIARNALSSGRLAMTAYRRLGTNN